MNWKRLINFLLLFIVLLVVMNIVLPRFFPAPVKPSGQAGGWAKTAAGSVQQTISAAKQIVTLGSAARGRPYHLALRVSTVSAGLESVELNAARYRQHLNSQQPLVLMRVRRGYPLAFSTGQVVVNGQVYPISQMVWTLLRATPTAATFAFQLADVHNRPLVRLKKIFRINPQTYDVYISQQIRNLSARPLTVQVDMLGPINLPQDDRSYDFRTFQCAGYRAASRYLDTSNFPEVYQEKMLGADAAPVHLGSFQGPNRLLWIAASNRFFTAIMRPLPVAPIQYDLLDNGQRIPRLADLQTAQVRRIGPAANQADPRGVCAVVLRSAPLTLPAHGAAAIPLTVYFGPKKRSLLAGSSSAAAGSPAYEYNLYHYLAVIQFNQGSWCAFLTFSWLALGLMKLLTVLNALVHNYGVAIMILVIVVRLLLHPLTRYSQVSMITVQRKMAAIQPEMERIRKKYAKDKKRQQLELMSLYKERHINPAAGVLGCLPMLLQMPIWIALYSGLQVDIDLRHAGFIPGWITDLSSPDTLMTFRTPFHVWVFGYVWHGQDFLAFNLLPILLGIAFFFQMRYQMKLTPAAADPQQRQAQKISQFSVFLFPVFLYNVPSGLNLYICASTLAGLIDTWRIRRHLERIAPALNAAAPTEPKKRK